MRWVCDYYIRGDGPPDDGAPIGLAAQEWLVAATPASPVDEQAHPACPLAADELDYALVRLVGKPGGPSCPPAATEGWLDR